MNKYGRVDVQIHVFLVSALVGGEWSASRPRHFTPGESVSDVHWIGGCWTTCRENSRPYQTQTPIPRPFPLYRLCYPDPPQGGLNKINSETCRNAYLRFTGSAEGQAEEAWHSASRWLHTSMDNLSSCRRKFSCVTQWRQQLMGRVYQWQDLEYNIVTDLLKPRPTIGL
jgi:hypothetical protein